MIIQVDSGGTLALMQQMSNMTELGSTPHTKDSGNNVSEINPFGQTFGKTNEMPIDGSVFNGNPSNIVSVSCPTNSFSESIASLRNNDHQDNDSDTAMS